MNVVLEQQQNTEYYRFILSAGEVLKDSQLKDMYYDLWDCFATSLLYDLTSSRTSILQVCLWVVSSFVFGYGHARLLSETVHLPFEWILLLKNVQNA